MCVVIAFVFSYLTYSFYIDGDITNAIINGSISIFFIVLLIKNILKTRKERSSK
ncbi:MAG: hypothetical protein U9O56_03510 [Campylobacterota bacterium]|nr:hypothetical protein [Campylobacterota bacterium]